VSETDIQLCIVIVADNFVSFRKEDYKPFMLVTNTKASRHEDELEMRRKARVIEDSRERQLEEIRLKLRLEGFGCVIEETEEEEDEFPG